MSILLEILLQMGGFLLGGLLLSILINSLALHFAKTLGIRNKNDVVIRWSNESKPSLGGISFYIVFLFSAIAFAICYFESNLFHDKEFLGLLGAASLAFILGVTDDAFNTRPLIKLGTQILCGVIIALSGTIINITHIPAIDIVITVIWIVGLMNSLNMLDNMDGITATVVLFILVTCLISSFLLLDLNTNFWTIILVSQIGAIIGFLKFNINPSKMFMGDTGSMFIGLFVGFFSIKGLWNTASSLEIPSWIGLIVTLVAFTPAACDTFTVVINRLKRGQSPMIGGKDHTTHHLVYSGKNDKQVWYVFLALSITSSIVSLILIFLSSIGWHFAVIGGALYFVSVFIWLYGNTIKYKAPAKNN